MPFEHTHNGKADGPALVVRTDANVNIGTGHVMRCLALSQAWQDAGGRVVFAMAGSTPAVDERLRGERIEIVKLNASPGSTQDSAQFLELAGAHLADWVVVDGYQFDAEYQRGVKEAGRKLLLIDDMGDAAHYFADLVLNQNAHASQDLYRQRESYTRLLLGPRFAMLRREFTAWRGWNREVATSARKVLVTIGGSDPDNITARVMQALRLVADEKLEATVVVGGSNPHSDSLEQEAQRSGGTVSLRNAPNMPELIARADVAISAAGTTCWEMCFLGLPALLIDVAANQRPVARELDHKGIAIHLGSAEDVVPEEIAAKLQVLLGSEEQRVAMSQRAWALVDGRGAERVLSAMRCGTLHLRRVEEKDCRLLWEWANDPDVRAASFSSAPISWNEHLAWFNAKLHDEKSLMLVATDELGTPVGQIRLDRTQDREADVDLSIAPEKRGAGYASCLIEKAAQTAFRETDLVRLHAFIRPGNEASVKAFERASFRRDGTVQVKGSPAVHYVRDQVGSK